MVNWQRKLSDNNFGSAHKSSKLRRLCSSWVVAPENVRRKAREFCQMQKIQNTKLNTSVSISGNDPVERGCTIFGTCVRVRSVCLLYLGLWFCPVGIFGRVIQINTIWDQSDWFLWMAVVSVRLIDFRCRRWRKTSQTCCRGQNIEIYLRRNRDHE